MCCRTSKYSRGDDQLFMNSDRANSRNSNRGSKKQKLKKTSSTSNSRYESSEEDEMELENTTNTHSKQIRRSNSRNSGIDSKANSLKRRTAAGGSSGGGGGGGGNADDGNGNNNKNNNNRKQKHAKSPMPEYNVSDLEQDNINDYYAVRHNSDGRYHGNESSSETSSVHNNPLRKPNFDAPAPAKGILKKSNSNPQLTKLEQEVKSSSKNNNKGVGPPGRYFLKSHTYIHTYSGRGSETGSTRNQPKNGLKATRTRRFFIFAKFLPYLMILYNGEHRRQD